MSVDYSKQGKGNDRKIVDVINKYVYNSKGRIITNPWDSDVAYLFANTVKFRGRVNATTSKVKHKTVKNGDMYINTADGNVLADSDWRNLRGTAVTAGSTLLYYDSEWSVVGSAAAAAKPDSESIVYVNSVYDFLAEKNTKQNTWYYAGKSDTAFFSPDSDLIYIIDGSSVFPDQDQLIEAYKVTGSTLNLSFINAGPKSQGVLRYIPIDGSSVSFGAITGGTIVNVIGNNNITIRVNDSELQRVQIASNRTPVIGDRISYTSSRGETSLLITRDGKFFKRLPKVRVSLDSEIHDRKAADSDIINGRYSVPKVVRSELAYTGSASTTVNYITASKTWTATAGTRGWVWDSTNSRVILVNFGSVIDVFPRTSNPNEINRGLTTFRRRTNNVVGTATIQTNGAGTTTANIYSFEYAQPTTNNIYSQLQVTTDSELTLKKFTQVTADTLDHVVKVMNYHDSDLNKRISDIESGTYFVKYNKDSDIQVRGIFFTNDSDGYLRWNPTARSLDVTLDTASSTTLTLGQGNVFNCKNRDATTLTRGTVVRIDGSSGTELVVRRASNDSEGSSSTTFGVVVENINSNANGFITLLGVVSNINTSAWDEGQALWLGTNGVITNVKPVAPNHLVFIGWVIRKHASSGSIYVKVSNGWELEELHNVLYTDPGVGKRHQQILSFDSDVKVWKNVTINTDFGSF